MTCYVNFRVVTSIGKSNGLFHQPCAPARCRAPLATHPLAPPPRHRQCPPVRHRPRSQRPSCQPAQADRRRQGLLAHGLELVRSPAKAQSGSPLHDQRFAEIDFTFDGAELPASQPGHLSEGAPPAALPVQTVRPRALPGCSSAAAACGAA